MKKKDSHSEVWPAAIFICLETTTQISLQNDKGGGGGWGSQVLPL